MDTLAGVVQTILSFDVTLWALLVLGTLLGLLIGVLPGLTFVMGVLLILPFTYGMDVDASLIVMVTVYVAGTYGGAITAILLRVPGEPNHVPLLWDGYTMSRRGQGAQALGWAATSALVGGLVSWLFLAFAAQPFAQIALSFSSVEYFVIVLLGLTSVLALSQGSVLKAFISLIGGMLLATVGVDSVYGELRFDFGSPVLQSGVDWIVVMIGVYSLGEVVTRFANRFGGDATTQQPERIRTVVPGPKALWERSGSLGRGVLIGSLMGTVPGAGATVGSFVAYGLERQFGKYRRDVGNGSPAGVIGPQAASTATVAGAFIPMLVLGIPGSASAAVILGALLLHDVQPGPDIFRTQPELIHTILAALLVGVVLMFVAGLLTAKPMIRILKVPEPYVAVFIVLFSFIGAFALRNSMADVWLMVAFAGLGTLMNRFGFPISPLVLGAILGPLAERFFLTSMISYANDLTVFVTRPISGALMGAWVLVVALVGLQAFRRSRTAITSRHEGDAR
jgi:putative tricarboxylic transport membrane protein